MGISLSKRQQNHHFHRPPPPLPPPSSSIPPALPPLTPPPHPSYSFPPTTATRPPPSQNPYPLLPPPPRHNVVPTYPPPPPPSNSYNYHFSFNHQSSYGSSSRPVVYQNHYPPYYHPHGNNGWGGFRPPPAPLPVVPYVDHQNAKKIKNDVNVHKDTIRIQLDELNKDSHLVTFTFDALVDGSITIFYFAKEGANCKFSPVYPEIKPVQIPFEKGLGQKFCQPSGTGIDLGFFDVNELSKPIQGEEIFPLIISAESCLPSKLTDEKYDEQSLDKSPHAQITEAVLVKNNEDHFLVKVIKQILWIEGVRYELREIYGISNSDETTVNDEESGKECVICMTEPKDTAVLPCRHMCLCSECAKALRHQSNKCPICRQPIEELLEIKWRHHKAGML
ncbi:probable E3 ubiquitin-protein ligase LUL4 isoform X1 [Nicotiana tomentosiformis]|uniref:probable E3 ubiquitin-protein ligase LUL4 isoform X1 n=1 Tax=Nicotiana tomentosiformis TaxID=4098 RepID=UPI000878938E|nr:probable E3 ubiquitin-protein ligase LUL4 isoform X1 [Nicotiana tomentosiformis]